MILRRYGLSVAVFIIGAIMFFGSQNNRAEDTPQTNSKPWVIDDFVDEEEYQQTLIFRNLFRDRRQNGTRASRKVVNP